MLEHELYIMEDIQEGVEDHIIDSKECDEEIEVEEVVPEITLNALLGSPSPKTMRVVSNIKNHKAVVLLNTSSTHNFLN